MENMDLKNRLRSDFRNKKVFVTGHTGFKGAWLTLLLKHLGANVKGYALEAADPSLFKMLGESSQPSSVIADIRDYQRLKNEISEFHPDYIFHLAAQSLVLDSVKRPRETFDVNAIGTVNILEAIRENRRPCKVVIVTTDKVYHQSGQRKIFNEQDRLGGHDPYSASKACCEMITHSYANTFFKDTEILVATARAGNVIGGGDFSENRILPDLVRSILSNQSLLIRNPESIRPWQHVLDVLMGYLMLASSLSQGFLKISPSWNFAPTSTSDVAVKEIVEEFIKVIGKGTYHAESQNSSPHESTYLQLDASLANRQLNWHPRLDVASSVQWAAEWYKDVLLEKISAEEKVLEQINDYLL